MRSATVAPPASPVGPHPREGRFVELDGLRGIAALAVVAVHFTTEYDRFFPSRHPLGWSFPWGGLGVQLFFLISGFVIFATTQRHSRPASFVAARATRLYPAYWVCLTFTTASTLVWDRYAQPWPTVAVNFTMLQSYLRVRDLDGAYWSLPREISFYALITIMLWLLRGRISDSVARRVIWLWTVSGVVLGVVFHLTQSHAVDLLSRGLAAEFAPLFGIGMVMTAVRARRRRLGPDVAALGVLAGILHYLMTSDLEGTLIITLLIVPAFVFVTARPRTAVLRWRVVTWFGAISYPLYLLHQNIGHAVIHATAPTVGVVASRVLGFGVVVLLAWLVHEIVEVRLGGRLRRLIPADQPKAAP